MAEHDMEFDSISGLIRGLVHDARELIREEIALARAEIREEIAAAQAVGMAFAASAVTALLGATLVWTTLGGLVAWLLIWPTWAGYGIVAVLLLVCAFVFLQYGRRRLAKVRALPKTTQTVKENLAWMQSRSAEK